MSTDEDKRQAVDSDATYDHVIKCTGLFGGVQGLNMLVNIIRNKVTAKLLGPAGTGFISLLANFIELINSSSNFGLSFSAIKHVSEVYETADEHRIREFIGTVRMWSLMAGILGILIALIVAVFEKWTDPYNIIIVSPVIGMLPVIAGEQSILKGTKKLKPVAVISVFCTLATLIVTVPIYYVFGFGGIAAALLANHTAILAITLCFSTRHYPYRLMGMLREDTRQTIRKHLKTGMPMLILGIGYVIAGVFGKGSEYVIRHSILSQFDGSAADGNVEVGLYTCAYTIIVTYASCVFTAMDVDFFPRLSAAIHDTVRSNRIVNQQIEVCVLLMAPLLSVLVLFLPHLLQILFDNSYYNAIPMATCAAMLMFFKAFFSPVEYIALAKGDSKMFMLVELCYDVIMALAVTQAYRHFGLTGCGIALSLLGLVNMLIIYPLYSWKYGFRFDTRLLKSFIVLAVLLLLTVLAVMYGVQTKSHSIKWTVGPVCCMASAIISLRILYRETSIIQTVMAKIGSLFHRNND